MITWAASGIVTIELKGAINLPPWHLYVEISSYSQSAADIKNGSVDVSHTCYEF